MLLIDPGESRGIPDEPLTAPLDPLHPLRRRVPVPVEQRVVGALREDVLLVVHSPDERGRIAEALTGPVRVGHPALRRPPPVRQRVVRAPAERVLLVVPDEAVRLAHELLRAPRHQIDPGIRRPEPVRQRIVRRPPEGVLLIAPFIRPRPRHRRHRRLRVIEPGGLLDERAGLRLGLVVTARERGPLHALGDLAGAPARIAAVDADGAGEEGIRGVRHVHALFASAPALARALLEHPDGVAVAAAEVVHVRLDPAGLESGEHDLVVHAEVAADFVDGLDDLDIVVGRHRAGYSRAQLRRGHVVARRRLARTRVRDRRRPERQRAGGEAAELKDVASGDHGDSCLS